MRRRSAGRLVPLLGALAWGCGGEFFTGPQVDVTDVEPGPAVYSASGSFSPLAYAASGRATYRIDEEGNAALELSELSIPPVPGTAVFLSNEPDLAGAVRVGDLAPGLTSARWTFRMPRGAVWRYVLVWSEELGVGVGRAALTPDG
ncbi:MAG: hypothetical protein KY453_06450 [Gemmatimonadetes bacterium]|nr:hypothetical protein [Gemmatimonadota bacterium]